MAAPGIDSVVPSQDFKGNVEIQADKSGPPLLTLLMPVGWHYEPSFPDRVMLEGAVFEVECVTAGLNRLTWWPPKLIGRMVFTDGLASVSAGSAKVGTALESGEAGEFVSVVLGVAAPPRPPVRRTRPAARRQRREAGHMTRYEHRR